MVDYLSNLIEIEIFTAIIVLTATKKPTWFHSKLLTSFRRVIVLELESTERNISVTLKNLCLPTEPYIIFLPLYATHDNSFFP